MKIEQLLSAYHLDDMIDALNERLDRADEVLDEKEKAVIRSLKDICAKVIRKAKGDSDEQ